MSFKIKTKIFFLLFLLVFYSSNANSSLYENAAYSISQKMQRNLINDLVAQNLKNENKIADFLKIFIFLIAYY